jgi:hypothetical protein
MIRETMLDPGKLRGCVENGVGMDDWSTARELTKVAQKIGVLDHERRELISRYAADQMTADEYVAANQALDEKLERLVRAKAKLVAALRPTHSPHRARPFHAPASSADVSDRRDPHHQRIGV